MNLIKSSSLATASQWCSQPKCDLLSCCCPTLLAPLNKRAALGVDAALPARGQRLVPRRRLVDMVGIVNASVSSQPCLPVRRQGRPHWMMPAGQLQHVVHVISASPPKGQKKFYPCSFFVTFSCSFGWGRGGEEGAHGLPLAPCNSCQPAGSGTLDGSSSPTDDSLAVGCPGGRAANLEKIKIK